MRPSSLRNALAATLVAFVLFVTACSSGGDGPTGIKPPPPPVVSLSFVTVSPDTMSLFIGGTKAVVVVAKYSDSTTKNVTMSVTWTSSTVATVDGGVVTAKAPGSVQLTASLGTASATLKVVVIDPVAVVYNQLSAEVQRMVKFFMASNRALWRPDISQPLKLYVDPNLPAANVAVALQNWKDRIGVSFAVVADSTAPFKLYYDSTIVNFCGLGGTGSDFVNDATISGRARIFPDLLQQCSSWEIIAHEIGHMLGSGDHSPEGTDIMSFTAMKTWNSDQTSAFQFVFHVAPPGWKVP